MLMPVRRDGSADLTLALQQTTAVLRHVERLEREGRLSEKILRLALRLSLHVRVRDSCSLLSWSRDFMELTRELDDREDVALP